jgi:hypothetical protein
LTATAGLPWSGLAKHSKAKRISWVEDPLAPISAFARH